MELLRGCQGGMNPSDLLVTISFSYLALVDVELDGVLVDDGVELVHEDVLEVGEHLVDLVEALPPPRHRVQARRVLGQVAQLFRVQHLCVAVLGVVIRFEQAYLNILVCHNSAIDYETSLSGLIPTPNLTRL